MIAWRIARTVLWRGAFALGAMALIIVAIPKPHLLDRTSFSPCYVDRNGRLLRLALADDDRYRVFVPLDKIAPDRKSVV